MNAQRTEATRALRDLFETVATLIGMVVLTVAAIPPALHGDLVTMLVRLGAAGGLDAASKVRHR